MDIETLKTRLNMLERLCMAQEKRAENAENAIVEMRSYVEHLESELKLYKATDAT